MLSGLRGGGTIWVSIPLMPKGVEHWAIAMTTPTVMAAVSIPLMPKGVEHYLHNPADASVLPTDHSRSSPDLAACETLTTDV